MLNKKRKEQGPQCETRNIKRYKTSYTVAEETFQPVGTNGDKEAPMKKEDISPQSNEQFTETALPNTVFLDIGRESRSERFVMSNMYEVEFGLMTGC